MKEFVNKSWYLAGMLITLAACYTLGKNKAYENIRKKKLEELVEKEEA